MTAEALHKGSRTMSSMEMEHFCAASRVMIVAGKGGVGKTTVTAVIAAAAARAGASVLIVEVEGKSGLARCFAAPPLEYGEAQLRPLIRARTLTPDEALLEYLEDRGLRRVSKRLVRSGALDVVATAVPGMKDILVLGKVKQLEQAAAADLVLIDAPAAGHAVSFLTSPRGLLDAVRVGPVHTQASEVTAMLADPSRCRVVLVTHPEETPVNELVDTAFALEERVGIHLGPIVVNAFPTDPGPVAPIDADAELLGIDIPASDVVALEAAVAFRRERHDLARGHADRLARALPLPQIRLPFVYPEIGPAEVDLLADALTDGVARLAEPRP